MRCQYMKKSSEGKGGSRTADEGMEKRMDATMDGRSMVVLTFLLGLALLLRRLALGANLCEAGKVSLRLVGLSLLVKLLDVEPE